MISQKLDKTAPKVLVENKISFNGPDSQLSIYDTYQQANKVKLHSDQPLFCAMISGKKIMHSQQDDLHTDFLPHESFVMAPNQTVEIDFPLACLTKPTRCLAIEISKERINQISQQLAAQQINSNPLAEFQYQPQVLHCHHNSQTQTLLQRMTHIFTENHPDREFMIDLAVNELTIRLLRQQGTEQLLALSQQNPEYCGLINVLAFIEQNLQHDFSVDSLCKIACMSRTKFFNQFKRALGCTPFAYQQQQRLKKAHQLIKQGQQITHVCFELGFSNPSHFSRVFKQHFGLSPKALQQQKYPLQ